MLIPVLPYTQTSHQHEINLEVLFININQCRLVKSKLLSGQLVWSRFLERERGTKGEAFKKMLLYNSF
jgi:hypothetical protein